MAESIRSKLLRQISFPVVDRIFHWHHRRRWSRDTSVHAEYFDSYQDRIPIVDAVVQIIKSNHLAHPSVFEFGCSGGNNLRLLRERLDRQVRYCGVDIQAAGIAFARQHFPEDEFYVSSATTKDQLPTANRFDIFLASGVLLYLAGSRAREVLKMAAEISDHQVICDHIDRFDSTSSLNEGTFLHPFGAMCAASGLQLIVPPYLPSSESRLGVFVTQTQS